MNSSLRERFERRGRIRAAGPASSGSPVDILITGDVRSGRIRSLDAILCLRGRGAAIRRAKAAVEEMIESGTALVHLSAVPDVDALAAELAGCGVTMRVVGDRMPDVRAIRDELGLTQEEFALRFGLDVAAVRNWEAGRRKPDRAARSYLAVIARDPRAVERALLDAAE